MAAMTRAPLTAIVMVPEMTGQCHLTLPAVLACGVAHATSSGFGARPLYGNPMGAREETLVRTEAGAKPRC